MEDSKTIQNSQSVSNENQDTNQNESVNQENGNLYKEVSKNSEQDKSNDVEMNSENVNEVKNAPTIQPSPNFVDEPSKLKEPNIGPRKMQRLMIYKIELNHFKSYAKRKEIGPLHKNFTSVVGPNGSGKSNLIESLLFVFGYRANKMRTKKVSHLVHKSEKFSQLQYTSVSVFFQEIIDYVDDENKYEPVPNTQFVVSRVGFQDNTSAYYIDRKKCSLQDVTNELRSKGIDLKHNRFLILQGEVEMISQMSPKGTHSKDIGLLEFLEDIIGSNKYVESIEFLSTAIDECSEQKVDKTNTVKLLEKGVKGLEKDKNFAINYVRKEERYYKLRHIMLCSEKGEASVLKDKISIKVEEYKNQLKSLEQEVKTKHNEYKALVNDIKKTMENFKESDKLTTELDERFREFEREDIRKREDMKHHVEIGEKMNTDIKNLTMKKEQNQTSLNELHINLPLYEQDWEGLSKDKETKKAALQEIEQSIGTKTEELRMHKRELENDLRPKELEQVKCNDNIAALKIEIETIQKRLNGYYTERKRATDKQNELTEKLEKVKHDLQDIDLREKANNDRIEQLKKQKDQISIKIKDFKDEMYRKADILEVAKACINDQKKNSALVGKLLEAQKRGKIRGVVGRLGNLGQINTKYDVAISTACPLLDAIVVQTVDDGTACMNYLKAYKIGQGNFLCLDKMRENFANAVKRGFECPDKSKRLFDLIYCKPDYKEVFYFAIRDTLVCDTLNQATDIAYKSNKGDKKARRHRVVTIEGELIEKSGTLSGGGKPRKGMMTLTSKSKVSVTDIEYSQESIEKLESEIYDIKTQLKEQKKQMSHCFEDLSICEDKVDKRVYANARAKSKIDQSTYNDEMAKTEESMNKVENKVDIEKEQEAINQLQLKVDEFNKTLDEVNPLIDDINEKIKAKENEIVEVGGEKYRKIKEEFHLASAKEEQCQTLINKTKGNVEYTTNEIEQLSKELMLKENEISKNNERVKSLEEELKALDKKASEVLTKFEEAKKNKEAISVKLEGRRQEFDQKKKAVDKLEAQQKELTDKCTDTIQKKRRCHETMVLKDDKIKENLKEYKRVKINYAFWPYIEQLERGELPSILLENENYQPAASENKQDEEVRYKLAEKRGINNWEYYINMCEMGVPLTLSQCEHIGEQKLEIYEALKETENLLNKIKPNLQAIDDYKSGLRKYMLHCQELKQVENKESEMKNEYDILRRKRYDEFMRGFDIISRELKKMYQTITMGGDAELELVDHLDPFSEGINFSVRPLKKTWKQISKLSGGEKTLSSLSLIFALHHFKPTPIYFMDEIDAALDFKNVAIVANYIRKKARNAQFLIISLRQNMFELANKMVGIYKIQDVTKTINMCPRKVVKYFKIKKSKMNENEHNEDQQNETAIQSTIRQIDAQIQKRDKESKKENEKPSTILLTTTKDNILTSNENLQQKISDDKESTSIMNDNEDTAEGSLLRELQS